MIVNLAKTLKSGSHDVSVSNIIVSTEDTKLNEKECEVNFHLKAMCKEKNLYLIDHSKKIKQSHLNRGKLHLNQKQSKVLGDVFMKQICTVFNRHCVGKISDSINEECKSNISLENKKRIDNKNILKSIRTENSSKLIYAHLNIYSIRKKFEFFLIKLRET